MEIYSKEPCFIASDEGNYRVRPTFKNGRSQNQLSQKQLDRREISATKSRRYVNLIGKA